MSSPAYYTSEPTDDPKSGAWTDNPALWVTRIADSKSKTSFWVLRKNEYTSTGTMEYKLEVPTSQGNITIPRLGNKKLTLSGRDSKVFTTMLQPSAYPLLIYSSSDPFNRLQNWRP